MLVKILIAVATFVESRPNELIRIKLELDIARLRQAYDQA